MSDQQSLLSDDEFLTAIEEIEGGSPVAPPASSPAASASASPDDAAGAAPRAGGERAASDAPAPSSSPQARSAPPASGAVAGNFVDDAEMAAVLSSLQSMSDEELAELPDLEPAQEDGGASAAESPAAPPKSPTSAEGDELLAAITEAACAVQTSPAARKGKAVRFSIKGNRDREDAPGAAEADPASAEAAGAEPAGLPRARWYKRLFRASDWLLETINRPFSRLPAPVRDVAGLVGLTLAAVSLVGGAAVDLLLPQRDALTYLDARVQEVRQAKEAAQAQPPDADESAAETKASPG